jgi:Skp family chaperone for outer membrane proteins
MKSTLLFAIAATIPGVFLMQSTGSSSVAVIDFDRAVAETTAGADAIKQLNAFETEQSAEIQKKQKEAEDLQNKLRVQDRALSDAARNELTKSLQEAQSAVQTMSKDAQQKIQQKAEQLLVPVQQKTMDAVRTYAAQNSVKIVLDAAVLQNGLLYVHDTADITTEIIRRIGANIENPQPQKDAAARFIEQFRNKPWALRPAAGEADSLAHR